MPVNSVTEVTQNLWNSWRLVEFSLIFVTATSQLPGGTFQNALCCSFVCVRCFKCQKISHLRLVDSVVLTVPDIICWLCVNSSLFINKHSVHHPPYSGRLLTVKLLGDTANDGLLHKNTIWLLLALIWCYWAIVNKRFNWKPAIWNEWPSAVGRVAVNSIRWLCRERRRHLSGSLFALPHSFLCASFFWLLPSMCHSSLCSSTFLFSVL